MNAGIHNLDYAEQLYAAFQRDPASVPAEWRRLFERTADGNGANGRWQPGPSFQPLVQTGAQRVEVRVGGV